MLNALDSRLRGKDEDLIHASAGMTGEAAIGNDGRSGYCLIFPAPLMMDSSTKREPERMPGLNPTP
jgi:hypothetical protein